MQFTQLNLDQNITKALVACGYSTPTPVQAKAIPEIMLGRDLVASAQTGTGKTAAFVLPALHHLAINEPIKKPRILVLTPTRELADQITKAANKYGKFLRFNIISLVGGMSYHTQITNLKKGADIIVATPGRLMDHMEQGRVDLSNISMLVLDEADRMLDMGFIDDVQYIAKLIPNKRQTLLFSATVDKKLTSVVGHLLKNPVRIDLSNEKIAAPKIKQEFYRVSNQHYKNRLLRHLLNDENIFKAIIFSATKINADRLAEQLRDEGYAAAALHGDLRQNVRNRTVEQLRSGKIQFLVATDVAARGIDISDVTHVINYDLPKFCEDYVHRIGRTGRAGKDGMAISFVSSMEFTQLQRIERYIGQRFQVINQVDMPADDDSGSGSAGTTTRIRSMQEKSGSSNRDYFLNDDADPKKKASRDGFRMRTEGKSESPRGNKPRGERKFDREDRPRFNRDIKPKSNAGRSRFGHDDRAGFDDRNNDKPRFSRDERSGSGERSGKPRFSRDERSGSGERGGKPRFSRDERSGSGERSGKPRFSRDERSGSGERSGKPRFSRDERSGSGERSGKPRFSRDERSGSGERSGKPRFSRDERSGSGERSGKPRFSRDDKPGKSKFSSREDKPKSGQRDGKSRFSRDDKPKTGERSFAKPAKRKPREK